MLKATLRKFHKIAAPIVFLPLFVTVITGVAYRLGRAWFGLTKDQAHILMVIHEGEYLGVDVKPFYVLLNGIGLLWMLITGLMMSGIFNRKPKKKTETEST
jgi:hypothetical protein